MPTLAPALPGRFRPESLLRPGSVALLGAETEAGARILENLREGGFAGPIYTEISAADLSIIADETLDLKATYAALAAVGTFAAVVPGMASGLRGLALATGVRSLGPGSFGVAVPGLGLNATMAHLRPGRGRLALVSQSAALCRAVLDWAEPNGVGFSHIVGIGGNDDIGFAMILDWLARDPGTGAILLDIRRIKDARAFLSAARAAARLRPVVAIRAGTRLVDREGVADAVFEAALHRAGVLSVRTLEDLLAAAETLTRARAPRGEALAIATNAIGPAQMAADAALRDGLSLAELAPATREEIRLALPKAFAERGGADVPGGVGDIVYAGTAGTRLADAAALLAGAQEVGGVIAVHAPTGPADEATVAALEAASASLTCPLLVCVMGETTAAAHRRRLAAAGIPVFATPEQAVRGFLHLVQHRRNRAAAAELPPSAVPDFVPDRITAGRLLAEARVAGAGPATAWGVLAAYGLEEGAVTGPALRIEVRRDAMFGPLICIGESGVAGADPSDLAIGLPPLNLTLASAAIGRTRIGRVLADRPGLIALVSDALVRLSQLVVDFPQAEALTLDPVGVTPAGLAVGGAALMLTPAGEAPPRLALPPYPAELAERLVSRGKSFVVRPIRPEDAEAHAAFFGRLTPEDIRYRFFSAIRLLSPEQIARLTQIDYDREMAFLAVLEGSAAAGGGMTVGVARLVRQALTDEGEFAVVVQTDMKGHGIASVLMRKLIDWAGAQGMRTVVGQVLADNAPMRSFVQRLGFSLRRVPGEPDILEARLELPVG